MFETWRGTDNLCGTHNLSGNDHLCGTHNLSGIDNLCGTHNLSGTDNLSGTCTDWISLSLGEAFRREKLRLAS